MRPYHVAQTYDPMTLTFFPYNDFAQYLLQRLKTYSPGFETILDIACGTGSFTILFAQQGFKLSGLDISPEMLDIARRKTAEAGLNIEYICQDMAEPYGIKNVDVITCCYGGLNFLNSSELLERAFKSVYAALKPGGLFAFDQFNEDKMRLNFAGTKAGEVGNFFMVTRSKADEAGLITHKVTYFLRQDEGLYQREEELHLLRIHPFEEIKALLATTGFELLSCDELLAQANIKTLEDDYLFIARKPA